MAPLITLVAVTVLARLAGALKPGRGTFATLPGALYAGVAAMFILTGGAHFIGLRDDLVRMVPPALGNPGFWVTRRLAAAGLLLLLLAVFPANVYAARHQMTIGGKAPTPLVLRSIEQLVFLAAVAWAGFGRSREQEANR